MEIRPIKTEQDYQESIHRIEELWGSKRDTTEGDELDLLCTLVESYELTHYPIAPPDPIDAINKLPENLTIDQVIDQVIFLEKVQKGLDDSANGRINTKEQAKNKLRHYCSK